MQYIRKLDIFFKVLFVGAILILGLYYLKTLLMPLVFSILMALVLVTLCQKLESWKIGRTVSILIVLFLVFLLIASVGIAVSIQFNNFIADFPNLQDRFEHLVAQIVSNIESTFEISQQQQLTFLKENSSEFFKTGSQYFRSAVGATTDALTFMSLVPVYSFLLLLYRDKFKKVLLEFTSPEDRTNLLDIISNIKSALRSYVLGLALVVSVICVLNTTGLFLLGIEYAIFLGIFSALLTVIPYVGVFIGGLLPVLIAFVTKDSMWYPLGVIGLYWIVQLLEGNYITPKILGSQVNLNALAVIFGLLVGGQLWGITGMVIAIPVLSVLKVVLSHFPSVKPIATLLEK